MMMYNIYFIRTNSWDKHAAIHEFEYQLLKNNITLEI